VKYPRLLVAVALLFVAGCVTTAPFAVPELSENRQEITALDFDQVQISHVFDVINDQKVGANLHKVSYRLTVGNYTVLEGENEPALELGANEPGTLELPMDLRFDTLRARIGEFPDRATLPYELRAVTMAHSVTEGFDPPEATTDTLTFAGEFPILTRPRLFVDTLMIKSFNLAIAELEMRVRLVNPNAVPVTFNTGSYALQVNGVTWHNQSVNQLITIPPTSDIVLDTPFSMRPREFDTQVYRMLNMEQEFEYTVTGNFDIRADSPWFSGTYNWEFNRTGSHQFPRLN